MDRDGARAEFRALAGNDPGDEYGTTAGGHGERNSVATSTSPDPGGAYT